MNAIFKINVTTFVFNKCITNNLFDFFIWDI